VNGQNKYRSIRKLLHPLETKITKNALCFPTQENVSRRNVILEKFDFGEIGLQENSEVGLGRGFGEI
jgi:hypothetical protein